MKEQTLKELWNRLDPNAQANMLRFFSAKLFIKPATAMSYMRGYRRVPESRYQVLADYVAKTHATILKS